MTSIMVKKMFLLCSLFVCTTIVLAQDNLNAYKYVIVPSTYDFQHEADEYQLNSLSKFLFEKYGFNAVIDDEAYPEEIANNACLALRADVLKDPGMFKTKLKIQLKNCKNEVVYVSKVGESREKQFKVAYNEALRDAFSSLSMLNHKFDSSQAIVNTSPQVTQTDMSSKEEIKRLQEEIKTLKREKQVEVVNEAPKTEISKPEEVKSKSVNFTAKLKSGGVFNYDLIDENNQIAYTILFSGKEDVYMVKDTNAIIYKMNGNWVLATSKPDNSLEVKAIKITF